MEEQEQQSFVEDQELPPPDSQSIEDMQKVDSDVSPADVFGSPSSQALGKPRNRGTRNSSCMVGLRKLRILLWKNFLLRRRSWILLLLQILSFVFMICAFVKIGPPSGMEDSKGPIDPEETSEDDLVQRFKKSFSDREILYVANDQQGHGQKIIDSIEERLKPIPISGGGGPPIWIRAASETEVEAEFSNAYAGLRRPFGGAVIFEKVSKEKGLVSYKIRKSDDGRRGSSGSSGGSGSDDHSGLLAPLLTGEFFSTEDALGKGPHRCEDPRGCIVLSDEPYMLQYQVQGILGLQILIDHAAIKAVHGTQKGLKRKITLKSFPYPKFRPTNGQEPLIVFSFLFMLVLFTSNAFLARSIGSEKETGVKELMKLCGYPGWMQSLAWYLIPFLLDLILLTLFVLLLKAIKVGRGNQARPFFENSDFFLLLFTFLLVMISNNAFIFFISSLTKSTALATAAGIILPLAFIIVTSLPDVIPNQFRVLMAISLVPQACFVIALKLILAFEGDGRGIQWYMLSESQPNIPKLNLGLVIMMFLIDIVLYQSMAVYFEAILPSEFGIRKQPLYPFQAMTAAVKSLSRRKGVNDFPSGDSPVPTESRARAFESPKGHDKPVGVEVRNLVKKFGRNKTAVNGVSLKMYDGEIFALLGHNGAGKTTLISLLTGLFAPTSGTAIVCGYDIRTDLDKVRQSLGLCPQHDMLFSNLTVLEHLMIFGQMKGQKSSQVKQEALALLQKMNLADKQNVASKNLSGGQKRKLCLGMALIGGAKVVILDEPTSGMDPEARRAIWDILLRIRGHRTILLTTHFMEEADALGERIGIMAAGQLECCGTPAFLKSFYGTGYTLKMALLTGADKYAILTFVQKHISNATMKPIHMPNEVFISLPMDATGSSALISLFSALTEKKKEMCIESLGLSVASMDEIFVKVGELSEKAAVEAKAKQFPKSKSSFLTQKDVPLDSDQPASMATMASHAEGTELIRVGSVVPGRKNRGLMLVLVQMSALIVKRFICTKRKIWLLIFQIIIPAMIMLAAVMIVKEYIDPGSAPPPLTMGFKDYKNSRTLYSDIRNQIPRTKEAMEGSEAKQVADIEKSLRKAAKDIIFFREKMIVAAEIISEKNYTAWYNMIPLHAPPLAINLASNIRGRELDPPFTIQMTSHPLQTPGALKMQMALRLASGGCNFVLGFTWLMVLAFLLLPPFFVILPTEERLNNSRQLQLNTGLPVLTYWTIHFLWDLFILFIVAAIMIFIAFILEDYYFFSSHGGLGVIFLVILTNGFTIIPLAYLITTVPKSVAGAVIILILFLIIPFIVAFILTIIPATESIGFFMHNIASLGGIRLAFANIAITLQKNARCNVLGQRELFIVCSPSTGGALNLKALKSCCANFKPEPYLKWTQDDSVGMGGDAEVPGTGQLLLSMFVISLICIALHISSELGVMRCIRRLMTRGTKLSDFLAPVDDEDVRMEEERVAEMIATINTGKDALVVDTLCKNFGGFSAVSRLTFGVHLGECFGLLGTNGAGKTTSFRMLTGEEIPSLGNVYHDKLTLLDNRHKLTSQIGYCPQFDAFVPYFTGKENLQLFARLRGVPWRRVNHEADKLLESVGLTESANIQCRKYSGGMTRRLSAAIALIGNPPLVLLDEPTSGVDPMSRRQFWKLLEAVKGSGQSIILTSHSMDECEALCSRLGIMVNGQLQCIGGVQHLKHKFAQGYSLTLRLKPVDPLQQQNVEALNNEICEKFYPCILKDQHETVLQYQIENASLDWNVIYTNLEKLKKSYEDIVEDYSVTETSLEEVFLALSRKQYPLRDHKISMCRRVLTCQY